ncbi:coil containing protein [Vibrio phage 1.069.O._10N.286.49.F11]|uniref:Coil containing protein n=7 Tax=Autolykiviridae TaxID=2184034 RepID=A0A2I7S841_9VIRU|nr:coil containing protein [Vibrio phage 1.008.O._10N.286.54.E5]AUR81640.1 coil containing protein [Vibrio phage 1.011.O._10N.286.49.B11]AUR83779.1 coil containing protein [Vibrio phage 1.040.O._10N.286.45.B9]AUR84658.1 coil containing protein [Vibrio phage 1.062.O._10N.286.55.C3]AUR85155.1 coil containing protein [Vibrio phage 1.069.O._10N.286.49.F11]AUR89583.1 coil containing protein [Vibrio phage 1.125.O._10N.286.49.F5]AUS02072.1 coil containing protein [Vibrio phage 2.092.O._10N.286.52.B7
MSFRSNKVLPNFNGVGAGQTATLDVPIGSTYHQIAFEIAGVSPQELKNFKVLLNGIPHIELPSMSTLAEMNEFDGIGGAMGVLILDFERFGLLTRQARELTAIGTGMGDADPNQVRTFQIQMDIDPAATNPSIRATATTSPASMSGLIRKIRLFNKTPTGSGLFEISDLPKGDMINKVFFVAQEDTKIDKLTLELDNFVKFERTAGLNDVLQMNAGVRVPNPKMYVLDPTEMGYGAEVIDTVYPAGHPREGQNLSDVRFKLNMSGGQGQLVIVEYLGAVER